MQRSVASKAVATACEDVVNHVVGTTVRVARLTHKSFRAVALLATRHFSFLLKPSALLGSAFKARSLCGSISDLCGDSASCFALRFSFPSLFCLFRHVQCHVITCSLSVLPLY